MATEHTPLYSFMANHGPPGPSIRMGQGLRDPLSRTLDSRTLYVILYPLGTVCDILGQSNPWTRIQLITMEVACPVHRFRLVNFHRKPDFVGY